MASFQAKQVCKGREREKIIIIVPFRFVPTRCEIENSKKIAKKLQKLKNTNVLISSKNRLENNEEERK